MDNELLPCPFCGGNAEMQEPISIEDLRGAVMCMSCFTVVEREKWQDAEAAWNTRADDWQTVFTAPKDGTLLLGYKPADPRIHRFGEVVRCWWQPEFEAFISSCRVMELAPGYKFEDGSQNEVHSPVIEKISHWKLWTVPKGEVDPSK